MPKGQIAWNKGIKTGIVTSGFSGHKHSDSSKDKISKRLLKINSQEGYIHPNIGKHHTKEHNERISKIIREKFVGDGNPFYGRHHSEETKLIMSKNVSESILSNPEELKRRSEMMRLYNLTQKDYSHPWNCGMHPWDWMKISEEEFYQKLTESQQRRPNILETNFISLIKRNNLPFKYVGDGSLWICGKNPDFINEEKKTIIELFGDYWHEDEDEINRTTHFKSHGFNTIVVWESEIKNLSEEDIIKLIQERIK